MIQIHDIKPIVKIPDLSIFVYYGIITLLIFLVCVVIFYIYKFLKPKPKSIEFEYYKKLQNIDFKCAKKAAYGISKYGRLLAKDERQKRLIDELDEFLSSYKYKKDIQTEISSEIKAKFSIFMESLDA